MKNGMRVKIFVISVLIAVGAAGCSVKFWEPGQLGRFRPKPAVNVILDSLGVAEEGDQVWEGAEEPTPSDVIAVQSDYRFAPGDTILISIYELLAQGRAYADEYFVTETGKISIPEVGVIQVDGLTETQLEEEIKQIVSPSILREPLVTVILQSSQKRAYSILGNGVPSPGRFFIPRYDYRLTDALATSSVSTQFNVSYIYVSRNVTGYDSSGSAVDYGVESEERVPKIPQEKSLEYIRPQARAVHRYDGLMITASDRLDYDEFRDLVVPRELHDGTNPASEAESIVDEDVEGDEVFVDAPVGEEAAEGDIEWIFENGKWIPVGVGGEPESDVREQDRVRELPETLKPLKRDAAESWDEWGSAGLPRRVIQIPTDKLMSGDPRYNIVVKPGDSIYIPVDVIGEFCIMGNVNSQGFIPLTGRPMTLKMAIAAAGGLGPLAWPKKVEVIRRIGRNREEIVLVDLDKIASGEQPDFFIKQNDLINVGTHATSRWRAILRNAFRATYGFGFIYDRNFADRDQLTSRPLPRWF